MILPCWRYYRYTFIFFLGGGGEGALRLHVADRVAQEQTGSHFDSTAEVGEVQEIPGPVSEDMLEIDHV